MVCVSVCLLATSLSCAKTPEPIEMLFEAQTRWGRSDHVLGGGPDPLREGRFGGSYFGIPILARCPHSRPYFWGSSDAASSYESSVMLNETKPSRQRPGPRPKLWSRDRPVLSPDFTNSRCLSFPSLSNAFLSQVTQSLCTFPTQRLLLRVQ